MYVCVLNIHVQWNINYLNINHSNHPLTGTEQRLHAYLKLQAAEGGATEKSKGKLISYLEIKKSVFVCACE